MRVVGLAYDYNIPFVFGYTLVLFDVSFVFVPVSMPLFGHRGECCAEPTLEQQPDTGETVRLLTMFCLAD